MVTSITKWLRELPAEAAESARRLGRPLVTLAYAQSLDGCLAFQQGRGLALSGPESLRLTHRLRATHSAILVGIGTVLADDPQLNVRLVAGADPQPVVLDTRLRMPPDCKLLQREDRLPWIFTGEGRAGERARALQERGARIFTLSTDGARRLDLVAVLNRLAGEGIDSLMVEGGAQVLTGFLARRLFDFAVITIAPLWLGGYPVVQAGLRRQSTFPALTAVQYEQYGEDLVVWGRCAGRDNV